MMMVSGQIVVENGRLVNANLQALIDQVNQAAPLLFQRRDQWFAQQGKVVNELQHEESSVFKLNCSIKLMDDLYGKFILYKSVF